MEKETRASEVKLLARCYTARKCQKQVEPRACAVISEPECQMVEILNEEMLKAVLIMSDFDMVYQAPF